MRIEKYLADMQVGTRSDIKKMIRDRRIAVDGITVSKAGMQVNEDSIVTVDGNVIEYIFFEYVLLNKPSGYVCTLDSEDNVMTLVASRRNDLFPVGRLDKDTEGVLILTNDGDLAHRLISPKNHVDKTYYLETAEQLPPDAAQLLAQPIQFAEFISEPAEFHRISDHSGTLTIHEGKYHQVKRMLQHIGCQVTYLNRTSFAFLNCDGLKTGEFRSLTDDEISGLKSL